MTSLSSNPFTEIRIEELHVARRRAHAERAMIVRQLLAALTAWRRNVIDRPAAQDLAVRFAHEH